MPLEIDNSTSRMTSSSYNGSYDNNDIVAHVDRTNNVMKPTDGEDTPGDLCCSAQYWNIKLSILLLGILVITTFLLVAVHMFFMRRRQRDHKKAIQDVQSLLVELINKSNQAMNESQEPLDRRDAQLELQSIPTSGESDTSVGQAASVYSFERSTSVVSNTLPSPVSPDIFDSPIYGMPAPSEDRVNLIGQSQTPVPASQRNATTRPNGVLGCNRHPLDLGLMRPTPQPRKNITRELPQPPAVYDNIPARGPDSSNQNKPRLHNLFSSLPRQSSGSVPPPLPKARPKGKENNTPGYRSSPSSPGRRLSAIEDLYSKPDLSKKRRHRSQDVEAMLNKSSQSSLQLY